MLSSDFLNNLQEYVLARYRPEISEVCSARDSQFFAPAEVSSAEETPPETSEYRQYKKASAAQPAVYDDAYDDDDFCDIIKIFSSNKLQDYIDTHQKPSFSDELMGLIDSSGFKDSEIYSRAGIDRRLFSKIRSNRNYHPSKQTVMAFCLALKLDKVQSTHLLETAGYSFSPSEIFDLVISYCIENSVYDLNDVNTALVYFELKPIGAAE